MIPIEVKLKIEEMAMITTDPGMRSGLKQALSIIELWENKELENIAKENGEVDMKTHGGRE